MLRAKPELKIRGAHEIRFSKDGFRKRRRGEVLHLALSYVRTVEDILLLNTYVRRALALLGEKPSFWNLEEDFVKPLERLFSLEKTQLLFSPEAKGVYCERSILMPQSKQVLRPDRMVLFEDQVLVVDFKSEEPSSEEIYEEYCQQVKNYTEVAGSLFRLPARGYLLFVLTPKVEEIR